MSEKDKTLVLRYMELSVRQLQKDLLAEEITEMKKIRQELGKDDRELQEIGKQLIADGY